MTVMLLGFNMPVVWVQRSLDKVSRVDFALILVVVIVSIFFFQDEKLYSVYARHCASQSIEQREWACGCRSEQRFAAYQPVGHFLWSGKRLEYDIHETFILVVYQASRITWYKLKFYVLKFFLNLKYT